jgi:uncharacterized membrane protein
LQKLSNLNTDTFPGSVFGSEATGHSGAAALYFLMPILAGIAASLLSLLIFFVSSKNNKGDEENEAPTRAEWLRNEDEPLVQAGADIGGTRFAQTQLSDMSTPFLK